MGGMANGVGSYDAQPSSSFVVPCRTMEPHVTNDLAVMDLVPVLMSDSFRRLRAVELWGWLNNGWTI